MHEDHPNLSPEINRNIRESEMAGGIWLKGLEDGDRIEMQTKNTAYVIEKRGGDFYISGSARFCPEPTKTHIAGSTWGGSMLKVGFVGIGMHLEFFTEKSGTVTTSEIKDARLITAKSNAA